MSISRVSSKGLITIPAEIRRKLQIKDGDLIIWRIDEKNKTIILRVAKDPLKYLKGKYSDPNITYENVEEEADRLVLGELNASDRARHAYSLRK